MDEDDLISKLDSAMQVRSDYLENAAMANQFTKARGGKKKKTDSDGEAHQVSCFTFVLHYRT